ncbi:MAG: hypothetical protein SPL80_00780 [Bacilli bacterium]|nr:hypothetical protein [Bacilli bacterium]
MDRNIYQYYVEGGCEYNFLHSYMHAKNQDFLIRPGRIEILNPITERISDVKAMTIKKGTRVVLVFDTDVNSTSILEENIRTLKRVSGLSNKDIIFVMSVKCFEEELVFSSKKLNNIKGLIKLFNAEGVNAFKSEFTNCKNLVDKLSQTGFDIRLMWSRSAHKPFDQYPSGGNAIKYRR